MSGSGIGRASALLASGTIVSRVLGFAKAALLAQTIGAVGSISADAYTTSTIVPNSIYAIIAQGILNAILVPQIVRASSHSDGGRAYINKLLTIGILLFAVIALAATVLAPALMRLYGLRGQQADLATLFAFWSLPQIFFLGLYTLLGEVLNARKSFGPFTWAPAANNVVGIGVLVAFIVLFGADPTGQRITADWSSGMVVLLAGGATAGIAVQALLLFVFWRRVGLRFRPDFRWRGVNLGVAGRAAGWTFAMLLCTQVAGWIETNVANSASGHGASTFTLANAWLIFMLPHSIIAVSIVTAYYTRMSEHAHRADIESFRTDFSAAIRTIALLIALSAAVLVVVAYPFSRVFTATFADTQAMGNVLIAYVLGLVPFTMLFVAQRAFYALGDTRTPFFFTLVQAGLVVIGVLTCLLLPLDQRGVGIAAVVSIAGTVQAVLAAILLRRRIRRIDGMRIVSSLWRFVVAALVAAAGGVVVLVLLGGTRAGGFAVSGIAAAIVSMIVIGLVMLGLYALVLKAVRSPELGEGIRILTARLGRR